MQSNYQGILKPNFVVGGRGKKTLSRTDATVIGRDKSCQIILDETNPRYQGISGRHAEIRPLATPAPDGSPLWQICDLNSTNGTYINSHRLYGCQTLKSGDKIRLDLDGPELIFELQTPLSKVTSYPQHVIRNNSDWHWSQILPIASTKHDLFQKAYLVPGIITVLFSVLLFATIGTAIFFFLLGAYLTLAGFYIVYLLCGKRKPWWVLVGSALLTGVTIWLYVAQIPSPYDLFTYIFYTLLPGRWMEDGENIITKAIGAFVGPGLSEELFKALPIFLLYFWGLRLTSPRKEQIGIWEPLDGILVGAASAAGFAFVETLFKYVPKVMEHAGGLVGLQLLIPRILGNISGHIAYSGIFGYFIGLSVLKSNKRWQILGVGLLIAAGLHGLWDSLPEDGFFAVLLQALASCLAYIFLMAAILKARQISPTRSQNFATRVISPNNRP